MIKHFKFFEGGPTKQRVFTDMMVYRIPQHHLEVPGPRLKPFTLNVFTEVLGRIPTYLFSFEYSDLNTYENLRGTTLGQLTSGELNIPWCFTELSITRISDNSLVSIHYNNVDEMDRRGLIFDPQDRVTICYKT